MHARSWAFIPKKIAGAGTLRPDAKLAKAGWYAFLEELCAVCHDFANRGACGPAVKRPRADA